MRVKAIKLGAQEIASLEDYKNLWKEKQMSQGKVVPFGYADGGVATLERLMQDERAYLVDIRLSPRSNWQAFNQQALSARFHHRYIHMPELGNVNYSSRDRGIQIADAGRGIPRLINGISQGYTLIVMCGCREYESCHRHTVVDLLLKAMPDVLVELPDMASPEGTLKCLSIQQPWTWLIANGHKDIENRDWTTSYRGVVLLHAGTKLDRDCFTTQGCLSSDFADYVEAICGSVLPERQSLYPIKAIVGMATLVDVVEESLSRWFVGKYGFVFQDARLFKKPIPYSGSLKLFDISREVIADAEVVNV